MNKKILVTGADGFIGSHLVELLIKNNFKVQAFCLYNSFGHKGWLSTLSPEFQNEIEFIFGDVRDPYSVESSVKGNDIIFHLASLIAIPYSYLAPSSYIDTNITGTLNVVQACRKYDVEQVIHTSTSEVYGTAQYVPIDENHPLIGQSPYSASKIGADQIALSFHKSFGVPVSIVRPFNTYGPRQSARAVIPTIITQFLAGNKLLKLGNLTATRDFSFVNDTTEGMLSFIGAADSIGKVINLGSNFEISIKQTAEIIAEVIDVDFEFDVEQERIRPKDSEVERLWADNSLAGKILNWKPKYSGLDGFKNGIEDTVKWFDGNKDSFLYNRDVNKYTR